MMTKATSAAAAVMGRAGRGKAKRRGDSEYYAALARSRAGAGVTTIIRHTLSETAPAAKAGALSPAAGQARRQLVAMRRQPAGALKIEQVRALVQIVKGQ